MNENSRFPTTINGPQVGDSKSWWGLSLIPLSLHQFQEAYRGFPTRMVYLYYISCMRYTIMVGNPRTFLGGNNNNCFGILAVILGQKVYCQHCCHPLVYSSSSSSLLTILFITPHHPLLYSPSSCLLLIILSFTHHPLVYSSPSPSLLLRVRVVHQTDRQTHTHNYYYYYSCDGQTRIPAATARHWSSRVEAE